MSLPFISVIVPAFDRKNYLKDSVSSIKQQTLGHANYEVIFLTNFEVDKELVESVKGRQLHSNEREGPALAYAIEEAHGDVISFLDDDDLWLNRKLEHVFAEFSADSSLGYYHNNFTMINEQMGASKSPAYRNGITRMSKLGRVELDSIGATFKEVRRLVNLAIDFNNSSISILRSLVMNVIDELKTSYSSMDTFLFYAAMTSDRKIVGDGEILTKYRLHSRNTSGSHSLSGAQKLTEAMYLKGKSDFNKKVTIQHLHLLQTMGCRNSAVKRSIECMIADDKVESHWLGGVRDRKGMLKDILLYLRYFSRYELKYNATILAFSLLYFLEPEMAMNLFLRHYYEALD